MQGILSFPLLVLWEAPVLTVEELEDGCSLSTVFGDAQDLVDPQAAAATTTTPRHCFFNPSCLYHPVTSALSPRAYPCAQVTAAFPVAPQAPWAWSCCGSWAAAAGHQPVGPCFATEALSSSPGLCPARRAAPGLPLQPAGSGAGALSALQRRCSRCPHFNDSGFDYAYAFSKRKRVSRSGPWLHRS